MHNYELKPLENAFLQKHMCCDITHVPTLTEAQMLAEAKTAVLNSKNYITAKQIEVIAGLSDCNLSTHPDRWKRDKQIFAFNHCGLDYFPAYALNPQLGWKPYVAMAKIMQIFGDTKSGWGCAFWFESVNGYLWGKTPKEIISTDPERVIKAASLETEPVAHG